MSGVNGARKVSGSLPVKGVMLGGAWAQWDAQLKETQSKLEATASELAAARAEAARELAAERAARGEEAEAWRLERAALARELSQLASEVAAATAAAKDAGEKEEAANAMCEAAVADRDVKEAECAELLARVAADARSLELREMEIDRLQHEVHALEKQGRLNRAHSELLLKEKNRLSGELLRNKRPVNYGPPVWHVTTSSNAPKTAEDHAAPMPSPHTPSDAGCVASGKTAARRPASASRAPNDSPASVHDSPASMRKMFACTPRGFGTASKTLRKGLASPSDAVDDSGYTPPSKDTIAERKKALMEAAKAALGRASRKPLLSAANKAAVTAGASSEMNPWVQ